MPKQNFRVYMAIYNEEDGRDEPMTFTDEPLYSAEEEIAVQAYRTQRYFKSDLAANQ